MNIIQPLNGHVLIRPRATAAPAGIEIPDSVDKEKPTVGEVLITADLPLHLNGRETEHFVDKRVLLAAGAVVIFNAFAPRKVEHDGEECLLVSAEDIYAVIQE